MTAARIKKTKTTIRPLPPLSGGAGSRQRTGPPSAPSSIPLKRISTRGGGSKGSASAWRRSDLRRQPNDDHRRVPDHALLQRVTAIDVPVLVANGDSDPHYAEWRAPRVRAASRAYLRRHAAQRDPQEYGLHEPETCWRGVLHAVDLHASSSRRCPTNYATTQVPRLLPAQAGQREPAALAGPARGSSMR